MSPPPRGCRGIHQVTTHIAEIDFDFDQYLIAADEPLLFHTAMRGVFPLVSAAIGRALPPDDWGSWSLRPTTGDVIRRLAELPVTTLVPLHGSAFTGDRAGALGDLASAVDARIGRPGSG